MWLNRIKPSKLELKLMRTVITSGLISVLLYTILINLVVYYINQMNIDYEVYQSQIYETAEELQNYVTENEVSITDIKAIKDWDKKQKLMHIRLVQNNKVIYDSLDYITRLTPKISYIYYEIARDSDQVIQFKDGNACLYITILYKQRLEQRLDYVIGVLCFLLFFASILREFKKLVRDILEIKEGIQVLEGGELSYELTSKRNDEITSLVNSINRMSKELGLQRREEELLRQKNYDLVTSISHDIRTPLTILNSYIDFIMEGQYSDQQELTRYLAKIKEKSVLINDLTDNLFTHFLHQNKDYEYKFETVIGNDFINYLLNSMGEGLRDKGYLIDLRMNFPLEFFLKIDVLQIERVFNNLEGNLIKYAQKSKPITYTAFVEHNQLYMKGENYVLNSSKLDSHGVGMLNCQEIVQRHLGEMRSFLENEVYHVEIKLPVYIFRES